MARVAHDVGILVDQEELLGLDAGIGIGERGAVPLSTGRVDGESLGDVVQVAQLAVSVEDVLGVLGQAGRQGVAVRVGPGAEAIGAALLADSGLNLLEDGGEIAGLSGQVDAQGPLLGLFFKKLNVLLYGSYQEDKRQQIVDKDVGKREP